MGDAAGFHPAVLAAASSYPNRGAGLFRLRHPNSVNSRATAATAAPPHPAAIPLTNLGGRPPAPPNLLAGRSRASTESTNSGNAGRPTLALATAPAEEENAADSGTSILNSPVHAYAREGILRRAAEHAERKRLEPIRALERIEPRFQYLFRLTQGALAESKQLGARELEASAAQKAVAGPCASLQEDTSVAVTITFIRHSESCANVMKRNTTLGGLSQKFYPDPELSERGIAMVKDRASKLSTSGIAWNMSPPWIIGCSTLFRAEQTAMYLSDGLREMRASDRIVVCPYIQETGGGQENTAMTDDQRLAEKLYDKLPGGASSRERLVTTLFNAEPEKERTIPNVDKFFKWLGCNLALVYKAGFTATNALPATMNLLIVTHSNLMTEIYKKLRNPAFTDQRDSSIKYDNLEAMVVETTYSSDPIQVRRPAIRYVIDKYVPSPALIKASCPDSVCRKPVCPKGAEPAPTAPTGTHPYQEVCDAIVGLNAPPANSAVYKARIKEPIVDKLSANTRNSVKRARKTMAAYDPPGAFRGIFGARPRTAEQLAANKTSALTNLGCAVPAREEAEARITLVSSNAIVIPAVPAAGPAAAPAGRSPHISNAAGLNGNIDFYIGGARLRRHRRMTRHHRTPTRIGRRTQKCRH